MQEQEVWSQTLQEFILNMDDLLHIEREQLHHHRQYSALLNISKEMQEVQYSQENLYSQQYLETGL